MEIPDKSLPLYLIIKDIRYKAMKKFKRHRDYGFWDQDIRMSKLSKLGDPLEKLNSGIDFEIFRSLLEKN